MVGGNNIAQLILPTMVTLVLSQGPPPPPPSFDFDSSFSGKTAQESAVGWNDGSVDIIDKDMRYFDPKTTTPAYDPNTSTPGSSTPAATTEAQTPPPKTTSTPAVTTTTPTVTTSTPAVTTKTTQAVTTAATQAVTTTATQAVTQTITPAATQAVTETATQAITKTTTTQELFRDPKTLLREHFLLGLGSNINLGLPESNMALDKGQVIDKEYKIFTDPKLNLDINASFKDKLTVDQNTSQDTNESLIIKPQVLSDIPPDVIVEPDSTIMLSNVSRPVLVQPLSDIKSFDLQSGATSLEPLITSNNLPVINASASEITYSVGDLVNILTSVASRDANAIQHLSMTTKHETETQQTNGDYSTTIKEYTTTQKYATSPQETTPSPRKMSSNPGGIIVDLQQLQESNQTFSEYSTATPNIQTTDNTATTTKTSTTNEATTEVLTKKMLDDTLPTTRDTISVHQTPLATSTITSTSTATQPIDYTISLKTGVKQHKESTYETQEKSTVATTTTMKTSTTAISVESQTTTTPQTTTTTGTPTTSTSSSQSTKTTTPKQTTTTTSTMAVTSTQTTTTPTTTTATQTTTTPTTTTTKITSTQTTTTPTTTTSTQTTTTPTTTAATQTTTTPTTTTSTQTTTTPTTTTPTQTTTTPTTTAATQTTTTPTTTTSTQTTTTPTITTPTQTTTTPTTTTTTQTTTTPTTTSKQPTTSPAATTIPPTTTTQAPTITTTPTTTTTTKSTTTTTEKSTTMSATTTTPVTITTTKIKVSTTKPTTTVTTDVQITPHRTTRITKKETPEVQPVQFRSHHFAAPIYQSTPPVTTAGPPLESLCINSAYIDTIGYNSYPGMCNKVVQCFQYHGRYVAVLRDCPEGYFWHQEQAICRQPAEVPCYDDPCLNFGVFTYNRTGGCNSYYTCQYGASVPACCKPGNRFNGYDCEPDDTCNDNCMRPIDMENREKYHPCKFMPDPHNPYGYISLEHNGLRIRACPRGTKFSAKMCGCRWMRSQSGRRRMKVCTPDFFMNFNGGFLEQSGSNMAFNVDNVVIKNGSAEFDGNGKITLWGFMNKELGSKFAIQLRFKPNSDVDNSGTLISNCGMSGSPTVEISTKNQFVQFLAKSAKDTAEIRDRVIPNKWNNVMYYYDGQTFIAGNNGNKQRQGLGGYLQTRSNAIVIGGCPSPGSGYKGAIDAVAVYSNCIPHRFLAMNS